MVLKAATRSAQGPDVIYERIKTMAMTFAIHPGDLRLIRRWSVQPRFSQGTQIGCVRQLSVSESEVDIIAQASTTCANGWPGFLPRQGGFECGFCRKHSKYLNEAGLVEPRMTLHQVTADGATRRFKTAAYPSANAIRRTRVGARNSGFDQGFYMVCHCQPQLFEVVTPFQERNQPSASRVIHQAD